MEVLKHTSPTAKDSAPRPKPLKAVPSSKIKIPVDCRLCKYSDSATISLFNKNTTHGLKNYLVKKNFGGTYEKDLNSSSN